MLMPLYGSNQVTYKRSKTPADDIVLWRPQDIPHVVVNKVR